MRRSPTPHRHPGSADIADAVVKHDAVLRRRGLVVWLGAEPTFTDRLSIEPEWQTEPLGADKLNRARRFAALLTRQKPATALLRTVGRQYSGESRPRWSFGVYELRRGRAPWRLPPDPVQTGPVIGQPEWRRFARALATELRDAGLTTRIVEVQATLPTRILFASDSRTLRKLAKSDPRTVRPPLESQPVPPEGMRDELSEEGVQLVALGPCLSGHPDDAGAVQLELPWFPEVHTFVTFLGRVGRAAHHVRLASLVLTGHPPPTDSTVAWATLTPDPGVLEVNMAPSPDVKRFLSEQRLLHAAASEVGLSGTTLLYNGDVMDSGGGQHLTFGGRTSARSPFFKQPRLLPRLIAFLNQHPSLSYWFAGQSVGSSSQQPRSDEVSAESFEGLGVALDLLRARRRVSPGELWSNLAPFLTDRFGNTHRAEINVEKLWNPYASGRGKLGLVELRAFGMTETPDVAVAVALLFRSVVGMLAVTPSPISLRHWGQELHDRFALPFHLQRDLEQVLAKLDRAGFGLPPNVKDMLLNDSRRVVGTAELGAVRLLVRRAERFWPLTGSLSAPEEASRWVDSSTQRLELLLRAPRRSAAELGRWRLVIEGMEVPWVADQDRRHVFALRGVRYKAFHPQLPLLPMVEVREPLRFLLHNGHAAWECRCHHWQPDGREYPGLPTDHAEARRRREERFQVRRGRVPERIRPVPPSALAPFTLDLRRIRQRS